MQHSHSGGRETPHVQHSLSGGIHIVVAGRALTCRIYSMVDGKPLTCSIHLVVEGRPLMCSIHIVVEGRPLTCSIHLVVAGRALTCSIHRFQGKATFFRDSRLELQCVALYFTQLFKLFFPNYLNYISEWSTYRHGEPVWAFFMVEGERKESKDGQGGKHIVKYQCGTSDFLW